MSDQHKLDVQKSKSKSKSNAQEARAPGNRSHYGFANNRAIRLGWVRNLLFGLAIGLPLSLYGLESGLWQAEDLLLLYGIVVATCLVLLPIYAAIVRELG